MNVTILREAGFDESVLGLSLSYGVTVERALEASKKLYNKDGGENKFLESMMLWLDVKAPRFWWAEADTYRLSTKQSESTMHTLTRRALTNADFECGMPYEVLKNLNAMITANVGIDTTKNDLPEGFLQRRIWVMSYKTMRNIIAQRRNHRLPQWKHFCGEILKQIEHKEYFEDLHG